MRKGSIIRRVDSLGRIVIPIELRKMVGMECGQDVEMTVQGETLELRRFAPGCIFCGSYDHVLTYEGKYVCTDCCRKLAQRT